MFAVLRATARHLGFADAAAGPVAARKPSAEHRPHIKTQSALYAPAKHMQAPTMFTLTPSPLPRDDLTAAQADAMDAAFRSPAVQRAAAAVRFKLQRLIDLAGYRAEINRAVASIDPDGLTVTTVVAVLNQRAEELDDLAESSRDAHARHDAASKACIGRRAPLRNAVGSRLSVLQVEFDALVREAESLRRSLPSFANAEQTRQMLLQQAGVSAEEMAAMRAAAAAAPANKEERRAQVQARIAEIKTAMEPLRQFSETGDESVLAGIAELEPLIAAQHAVEVRE